MISWLQGLIGNQQGINSSEYSQGLGLEQSALTQQGQEFNANLANQLALQNLQNTGQAVDVTNAQNSGKLLSRTAQNSGQLAARTRKARTRSTFRLRNSPFKARSLTRARRMRNYNSCCSSRWLNSRRTIRSSNNPRHTSKTILFFTIRDHPLISRTWFLPRLEAGLLIFRQQQDSKDMPMQ